MLRLGGRRRRSGHWHVGGGPRQSAGQRQPLPAGARIQLGGGGRAANPALRDQRSLARRIVATLGLAVIIISAIATMISVIVVMVMAAVTLMVAAAHAAPGLLCPRNLPCRRLPRSTTRSK